MTHDGLVAERADAPLSNSGDESREGSTPSEATHRHRPDLSVVLSERGFRGTVLTTHPCAHPGCDFQMERA